MHCGAEVTESSTNKQHHLSATIDAWKESLQNPFALACVLSAQINAADARRTEQEQQAAATRSAEVEKKALEDAKA